MPAISFKNGWLDNLLSGRKEQTTRPETDRFKVGDIAQLYLDQRGKIVKKPTRKLTTIGLKVYQHNIKNNNAYPDPPEMISNDLGFNHMYYAHFLGKVKITDVQRFIPSQNLGDEGADIIERWARMDGFKDFPAADEWFKKHYGYWLDSIWTVIRWDGFIERYFEPKEGPV